MQTIERLLGYLGTEMAMLHERTTEMARKNLHQQDRQFLPRVPLVGPLPELHEGQAPSVGQDVESKKSSEGAEGV